ncbi:hypothetical protein NST50_14010 [Paenibacillus sp. FSL E2-0202]|uniref:hypothetical protein n=1 Tax=Paenibacillus sp. FSL E2-0202 TaxID=2954505 RepID=UPI0030EC85EF
MTQVQMTDHQLNRALAELKGYTVYHYDKDVPERCYYLLVDPTGDYSTIERPTEAIAWLDAPWFTGDPAASLEVQAKAIEVDAQKYVRALQDTKYAESAANLGLIRVSGLLTASPRERAEAAYITLNSKQ